MSATTTDKMITNLISLSAMNDLRARYNEPQRHYHSWAHIEALLKHCNSISDRLNDKAAVEYAIYYHDAIYEPLSATNEEDSAQLLEELHPEAPAVAAAFVRATKTHTIPQNLNATEQSDCSYFLDMDISILGAPSDVYDAYAAAIRREYNVVPDEMYQAGRKKVLKSFLGRSPIFFTGYFREKFEEKAKGNLSRELAVLEGAPI